MRSQRGPLLGHCGRGEKAILKLVSRGGAEAAEKEYPWVQDKARTSLVLYDYSAHSAALRDIIIILCFLCVLSVALFLAIAGFARGALGVVFKV